ncbi:MAG: FHA domain-containing protein [Kiritimatiellaeota bacterium]|nr:FHA domain-containing protein [Kiritimatiellota bacterium]
MAATLRIRSLAENEDVGIRECPCGSLLTIGRGPDNTVHLSARTVSRSHALIRRLGDGNYYVVDIGSANGTFVNGRRVVVPYVLADGDCIEIGDYLLEFRRPPELQSSVEISADAVESTTTISLKANVQELTVLVTDIRGYSGISEQMSASYLAEMLGQWFARVGETVDRNGAVVDKFIGDAVMARWLAQASSADATVLAALRTALDIDRISRELSEELPDLPYPIRVGVGINTGKAVVGTLGSAHAGDYTAVGDAVNLAFAFEASTRQLNSDVVLGPDSYPVLPKAVWQNHLEKVSVKGKKSPVTVCSLTYEQVVSLLA